MKLQSCGISYVLLWARDKWLSSEVHSTLRVTSVKLSRARSHDGFYSGKTNWDSSIYWDCIEMAALRVSLFQYKGDVKVVFTSAMGLSIKYKPKNNKHFFCICCSHWESQRYKPTDRLASAIIVRKPKQFVLRLYYLAYAVIMIACDRDRQEKNECLSFLWLCFYYVATVVLILGLSRQWVKTNL